MYLNSTVSTKNMPLAVTIEKDGDIKIKSGFHWHIFLSKKEAEELCDKLRATLQDMDVAK